MVRWQIQSQTGPAKVRDAYCSPDTIIVKSSAPRGGELENIADLHGYYTVTYLQQWSMPNYTPML